MKRAFTAALVLTAAVTMAACSSGEAETGDGGETKNAAPAAAGDPRGVLERGIRYAEQGEFEKIWDLYTPEFQDRWVEGIAAQQAEMRKHLRAGSGMADELEPLLEVQYGVDTETFVKMDGAALCLRALEMSREKIRTMHVVGEPVVEGETARMDVAFGDEPATTWTLVKGNGGWLIDSAPVRDVQGRRPR